MWSGFKYLRYMAWIVSGCRVASKLNRTDWDGSGLDCEWVLV